MYDINRIVLETALLKISELDINIKQNVSLKKIFIHLRSSIYNGD